MASDEVRLVDTMSFQPVSVKTNNKPKEELEEAPPLVSLFIFTICLICILINMLIWRPFFYKNGSKIYQLVMY